MPDMKTALSQAITNWAKDDPAVKAEPTKEAAAATPAPAPAPTTPRNGRYFVTTNNVTRETFEYVRTHPGVPRATVLKDLKARGFLDGSIHSLLGQMLRQGLIREEGADRRMTCVVNEYRSLKSTRAAAKAAPKAKRKYVRKTAAPAQAALPTQAMGVAALVPPATEALISSGWSADTIMEHLSIKQARALYDELKKVFGNQ